MSSSGLNVSSSSKYTLLHPYPPPPSPTRRTNEVDTERAARSSTPILTPGLSRSRSYNTLDQLDDHHSSYSTSPNNNTLRVRKMPYDNDKTEEVDLKGELNNNNNNNSAANGEQYYQSSAADLDRDNKLGDGTSYADSDEFAPTGIAKVEAGHAMAGRTSKILLWVGIGLSCYIYSLDGTTTWQYLSYATSTVLLNSLTGTITTAAAIIIAVGKPLMAKFADVFGRGETYVIVMILYVIGYLCIASANGINQIAAGDIIYSFGYTGLQMMTQIVIADLTTLRWRGLSTALVSAPFIINNFVAAEIAEGILPNWRWGYYMFAFLVPACLTPVILSLLINQHKARKALKIRYARGVANDSWGRTAWKSFVELDVIGLILVAASLALILLPLTLAPSASKGWRTPSMIAMEVIGILLFPAFLWYETHYPANPIVPLRMLRNKTICGACLIGFLDFVSFYLQYTNQYNFVYVVKTSWTARDLSYFSSIQSLALTIFAILGGAIMARTRDVKWIMFSGLLIRLLGVGLMIKSRGANGNAGLLVMCQVLQGLGGGFAAIALQLVAQAVVTHADVATVTAMVLLITEVGNSVGSAIATSVYTTNMPTELAKYVPTTNATLLNELYQSITIIATYPAGSAIRNGAISAYEAVMFKQVLAATIVAVLPPIACFFLIKAIRLEDVQNMVDGKDLSGKKTIVTEELAQEEQHDLPIRA